MALPELTADQRAAHLLKAAETRTARAAVRAELKAGAVSVADLLERTDDPVIGKMRVSYLLESLPRLGKVRVADMMHQLQIAPSRRVGGLGERQRSVLLARLHE
ncbi:integration host factor, actinobacterial type [Nocardiopsis tropica]|uniref:integration host factor, actinobacterial type n=1 Tax=Tsukamurella strandjordii TaxID=147577 RepID=UPI0031DD12A1